MGNPDVKATGNADLWHVGKIPTLSPSKVPLPLGDLDATDPPECTSQMASRLVQPFLQGSQSIQTDRQRDQLTDHSTPCRNTLHLASAAMGPINKADKKYGCD